MHTAVTRQEQAGKRFDEAGRIRGTRLSRAQAAIRAAEERLQFKRADLRRFTELFESGLVSQKQLDESRHDVALEEKELETAEAELQMVSADDRGEARRDLAVSKKQVEEADGKLKLLLAGSRPEAIEAIEASLARLEAQRQFLAEQIRLTRIVSPTSGVVGAPASPRPKDPNMPAVLAPRLREKAGEQVNKGDLIARVFDLNRTTAELIVPEKEIAEVAPGQTVVLKARAYPDRALSGRVKAIAPAADDDTDLGRKVFRVTIEIERDSQLLKPEMTGTAKIFCGSRSIWGVVTRRIERYLRVEFWSWW
jgi:multidrug resistance efflux pump